MLTLNLPTYTAKVTEKNGKKLIFDPARQRYVALTPEEWVRQHFVNYLLTVKAYPRERVANEVAIRLNQTAKRCDTIVYNHYLEPLAVIEYKAPAIEITPTVFDQIVRYNMALRVPFLMVSNGLSHYCCQIDYNQLSYSFLEDIPSYSALM